MSRTYTYLAVLVGGICGWFLLKNFVFGGHDRTLQNDVVQGILIGFGLAFVTAHIVARLKATHVNGSAWANPAMACCCAPRTPNSFPAR